MELLFFAAVWQWLIFSIFGCFSAFYCMKTPQDQLKVLSFKLKTVWWFGFAYFLFVVITFVIGFIAFLAFALYKNTGGF